MDDISSEILSFTIEKLMQNGALDTFITPIIMKKGRPAFKITVLSENTNVSIFENILFDETKTLGIRKYITERVTLNRYCKAVEVKNFGKVNVKFAKSSTGKIVSAKPEYEDCKKLAEKHSIPLKDIFDMTQQVIQET